MKFFPKSLNPKNKEKFVDLKYGRCKCYLRRAIYEHIINHEEKEYFSLDEFNQTRVGNMKMTQKLCDDIIVELEKLDWKCKKSYGNTALFIFADKPPSNCYEEGF